MHNLPKERAKKYVYIYTNLLLTNIENIKKIVFYIQFLLLAKNHFWIRVNLMGGLLWINPLTPSESPSEAISNKHTFFPVLQKWFIKTIDSLLMD